MKKIIYIFFLTLSIALSEKAHCFNDVLKSVKDIEILDRLPAEIQSFGRAIDLESIRKQAGNMATPGFGRPPLPARQEILVNGKTFLPVHRPNDLMESIGKITASGNDKNKKQRTPSISPFNANQPDRWNKVNNVIYVSTEGSDNFPGTKKKPVATLNAALKRAEAISGNEEVRVQIAPGHYFMKQPLIITENDKKRVIFEGEAEKKPIFSGGIKVSNWKKGPGRSWQAFVPEVAYGGLSFEQFYVNGKRAKRARTPNEGWFFIKEAAEVEAHGNSGRLAKYAMQKIRVDTGNLETLRPINDQDRDNMVMTFYHKWDVTRKKSIYMDPDTGLFLINGQGMKSWNPLRKGSRYFLENYMGALDEAGEWYLSCDGHLSYIPREGEEMDKVESIAPVLSRLVKIEGQGDKRAGNKVFKNLSFQHSANRMPPMGNDPQQAAAGIDAAIHLKFAEDVEFINCEVLHTGNYALWFREGTRKSSLKNSWLHDLGAGGVKIGETYISDNKEHITNKIIIDNNIIQSAGKVYACGIGVVIFHAYDNKVTHNEISDLLYSGVSVGWVWGYADSPSYNNTISYNHISHIGWGVLSDMGAVYTLGNSPGTTIHNNVIHDVYSYDYGGWGLYTDEGSAGIVIENNLVYGCKSGGFHQHYGKENIIKNNIFAFSLHFQIQFSRVEKHLSFNFKHNIVLSDSGKIMEGAWDKARVDMDNNCYWDLRGQELLFTGLTFDEWKKIKDAHSIVADPMFRNSEKLDFRFEGNSMIEKIGFKPFDYSKAGVYGTDKWKEKARLPKDREEEFKKIVREREKEYSRIYK